MTNQTVVFLRAFNRWRRGDESMSQPCPRVVGEEIDKACDQIERLERERDNWRSAAAQAVADRDRNKQMADDLAAALCKKEVEGWQNL